MPQDPFLQGNLQRNADADARKQSWSDEQRKVAITKSMGISNNLQKSLALLLNPDTMQPLPGKEQQAAEIRQHLSTVDGYIQKLYDPKFNPNTGMVAEDPLHKLTDKLRITKAPEQPDAKTAGQQMQDLKDIQAKYSQEPSLLAPDERKQAAKITAGLEPRAVADKPDPENWEVVSGKLKDGTEVTLQHNKKSGEFRDLANKPISPDMLAGFNPTPKTAGRPKSQYDQQKEEFAKSLGKTPDQLTWPEEQQFLKQRSPFGDQRLQIALSNLKIAQATFDLKKNEQDFTAFMQIQKSLAPFEKIQTAAANADDYANNPSGPGDVALVFAYIEATKPTSGFRFTDTERKWIVGTRGFIEGAETRINQGYTGQTLSPEQRKEMVGIIKHAGGQVKQETNSLLEGAAQFKPAAAAAASNQVNGKRKVSVKKAMALPINQGKTKQQVMDDLKLHGYDAIDDVPAENSSAGGGL